MILYHSNPDLPLVAIAGRPNVGKSTLFNRFIKQRKAITDPTPGVTRDPVAEEWPIDDYKVNLVDTGGLKVEQEGFDAQVTDKSMDVIKHADLILLVLDVRELTAEDETFIEALRPFAEKIILVVNKVDTPEKEVNVWNFHSLGFSDVIGISAAHGLGCGELEDLVKERIEWDVETQEKEDGPEPDIRLALLGKPNSGKSTLLNQLIGSERSIVSEIPGTTRDVVEGRFISEKKAFRVLDTAGIRRKKKVEENVEYYSVNRAIKSIEDTDVVYLMIDSLEGLVDQEKKIAALIVKKGKGIILVLNKWDLMDKVTNQIEAVSDRVRFLFPILDFAPLLPLSAINGEGVDELLRTTVKVWNQMNMRIDTARLNKALKEWLEYNEPPILKNYRFKVRYITQVSANPVQFKAFVNRTKGFPDSYVQYLRNRIRKDLGFSSVPFTLELKER
ncbi:MAG: ribosome biogenesis GTPase Der [Spirochaetales bacterium]|nr:ribosome biogenesis GTPase Der [Spirochaetales bacterium]